MIIDLFNFWREVIVFRILKIHYLVLTRIIGSLIPNCLMWLDPYQFLKTMDMHYLSFSVAICGPWKRHNLFFPNTSRCTDNFLNIFCAYPVLEKKEALKYMVLGKVQRWKWIWISSVLRSKKDFLFQNQTFFSRDRRPWTSLSQEGALAPNKANYKNRFLPQKGDRAPWSALL